MLTILSRFVLNKCHFLLLKVVDDNQVDLKDDGPVEWVSYWKPNVTINLVDDFTGYVFYILIFNLCKFLDR